ncbi:AbrB/MazE/SpoVT family DNA-binding domain-containing protein [Paenibacillus sp. Dod16]|uniref:AbrB/MazE/SpoVT family DNA-binding domain-containing protein n=1 Tax=Paenibacillus sp. Dod16 TaxID=3416392 RepID=UPI003CE9FF42
MKDTGMTRELDALGRIVLPVELRRSKGIEVGDSLEFFTDGSIMMLKKYRSTCCIFCDNVNTTQFYKNYFICETCASSLHKVDTPQEIAPSTTSEKRKSTKKEKRLETLKRIIAEEPGLTQKEIALKMGISQPMVSLLKKECVLE